MSDDITNHPRITRVAGVASYNRTVLPPGPWHAESDHEDFRSPSGRPCILHRNNMGAWCGYVAVAPGHPWHGKDYDSIEPSPEVHGGLTYAASCQGPLCHVPQPGESDDVWWLGFDCIHSGDLSLHDILDDRRGRYSFPESYKTIGYVRAQTLRLAEQADEMMP